MNYISLKDLNNLGIDGLPKTIRGLSKLAERNVWEHRSRSGKGGGFEYKVSSLPPEIQAAIMQKQDEQLEVEAAKPVKRQINEVVAFESTDQAVEKLSGKQRQVADARCMVCAELIYQKNLRNITMAQAMAEFIAKAAAGNLSEAMEAMLLKANDRNNKATVSLGSLKNWLKAYREADTPSEKLLALAPKPTKPKTDVLAFDWLPVFRQFYSLPTRPKMAHAYERFAAWYRQNKPSEKVPSLGTVRRAWLALPPIMQERGRSTGSELKALAAFVKRDWVTNLKPLQVAVIDGHTFKAQVKHPVHGQPFKPEVTLMIDGNTRLVLGFSIGLAESTMEVMNAVRHSIESYGLMTVVYSDNGAGETGLRLDDETVGIFSRLGIRHETGIAGNPQGRGIIERWWQDNLISLARTYPTFRGSNMDSGTKNLTYRKQMSAFNAVAKGKELTAEQEKHYKQVPTWKQFAADVQRVVDEYNHRPHSSLPKNEKTGLRFTPAEFFRFQTARYELVYDKLTESELKTLFMPMEKRVTRRGWLELFNESYFHQDLVEYHGQTLHIAYDMADAAYVMVYKPDHTLICKAILNGNTRDAFAVSMLEKEEAKRAERKIKRAEQQIALARAEANPALEQAQVWDELGMNMGGEWYEPQFLKNGTDDEIVLWAVDRE